MKKAYIKSLVIIALSIYNLNGQVYEFVVQTDTHRIIKDKTYIVETVFNTSTGEFKFTRGGFYSVKKTWMLILNSIPILKMTALRKCCIPILRNGRKFLHQNKSYRGNG